MDEKIPPISLSYPPDAHPDRSLVRFHAMIQDIPSPEMYLSRIPEGRCGGWNLYQDLGASTSTDINFHNLQECSVFWAITVPGESQWHAERLEGALFDQGSICRPLIPLVLIVGTIVSKIPLRTPYLTTHRHKLPNPQSADFGILLKARSPTPHIGPFSSLLCRYTTKV